MQKTCSEIQTLLRIRWINDRELKESQTLEKSTSLPQIPSNGWTYLNKNLTQLNHRHPLPKVRVLPKSKINASISSISFNVTSSNQATSHDETPSHPGPRTSCS